MIPMSITGLVSPPYRGITGRAPCDGENVGKRAAPWAGVAAVVLLIPFALAVTNLNDMAALMLASAMFVMIAVVVGIRMHRPAHPLAWWLILTSVGLALLGNIIFAVLNTTVIRNPAAINIIYGITYPILCSGVAI